MVASSEEQWAAAGSSHSPPFVIGKNKVVARVIFVLLSAELQHLGPKLFEITSVWQKQTFKLRQPRPSPQSLTSPLPPLSAPRMSLAVAEEKAHL